MRFPSFVPAAVAVALLAPSAAHAQARGYLARLGTDTLSIERYTRTGNVIEGQQLVHAPAAILVGFTITLNADGTVNTMEQRVTRADGTPMPGQPASARIRFTGDSAIREMTMNGTVTERRSAVPRGTLPQIGLPWLVYEMGIAEARRTGQGAYYTMSASPAATAPTKWAVTFVRPDSAEVDYFGAPIAFTLESDGRIRRADGIRSTNKAVVTPLTNVDLGPIATAWARADAAGQSMGMPSPRDTARGSVQGATLAIEYGRPSKRGRVVWGTVVPYGEVWRLGANAATMFTTDRDLEIGGQLVPAGSYTLWLIPQRDGGTLIVNKQVRQWGTQYDEKQDLVRLGVQRARVPGALERFAITIDGGELRFAWDDAEYSVPVRVRR
jgi:hypothetical protein